MDQNLINFIVTVAANVIADYISKWLDRHPRASKHKHPRSSRSEGVAFGDEPNRQS